MAGKSKIEINIGDRFGRWVVIGAGPKQRRARTWEVRCDCGNKGKVVHYDLHRGHSQSCGCFRLDEATKLYSTHGESYKIALKNILFGPKSKADVTGHLILRIQIMVVEES